MRQMIEASFLDWTREKSPKIRSRGISAILAQRVQTAPAIKTTKAAGSSRCTWPSVAEKAGSRYLSRRIWMS